MSLNRSDYQRRYYLANKERLKERRQPMPSNMINLFEQAVEKEQPSIQQSVTVEPTVETKSDVEPVKNPPPPVERLWLSTYLLSFAVLVFVLANTFFLVHEDVTFFLLKKYTWNQAIFFGILIESALLLLAFLAGKASGIFRKLLLYLVLGVSIFVNAKIVCLSVEKRDLVETQTSDKAKDLRKEIETLERREAMVLANIDAVDAKKYPTKRSQMIEQLEQGVSKVFLNL